MKHINRIIDNKELVIGQYYVYISNDKQPLVVIHEKGKFQNDQHEKNYLESQGAIYMLRDLESKNVFDLHQVDYLESRYKIFPLNEENLGFILNEFQVSKSKKTQNVIIKHFREISKN